MHDNFWMEITCIWYGLYQVLKESVFLWKFVYADRIYINSQRPDINCAVKLSGSSW